MKALPFKVHTNPPAYSGFWSLKTNSPYLSDLYLVRSGKFYRITGFPENTLPSSFEGEWVDRDRGWAKAAIYEKKSDCEFIPLSECCDNNIKYRAGNNLAVCAFTVEGGRFHIRYYGTSYRIRFVQCSKTEADLNVLFG